MNISVFLFAVIKFHLYHFSHWSSSAFSFNLNSYWYATNCSNCISSFSRCSIWMFPHCIYCCLCTNSNWIPWISLTFYASFVLVSNVLNLKYFKLNTSSMDYNTVTDEITRLTEDLNTWSSTLSDSIVWSSKNIQFEYPETFNLNIFRFNSVVVEKHSIWIYWNWYVENIQKH